jgi:hypothetical protein
MDEFNSRNRRVKFSSGSTEALYYAWVELGHQMQQTEAEPEVMDWLSKRLANG